MNIFSVDSITFNEPALLSTGSFTRTITIKHRDGEFRLVVFSTYRDVGNEERMASITPYFKGTDEA